MIGFVWNAISGDVIGNAAYDGVKAIFGKRFNRLASYAKKTRRTTLRLLCRISFAGSDLQSEPLI